MEEKRVYSILVEGDGRGNYPKKIVQVFCTPTELDTIGKALASYVLTQTNGGCCCVANEGEHVSNDDFSVMFSDCM